MAAQRGCGEHYTRGTFSHVNSARKPDKRGLDPTCLGSVISRESRKPFVKRGIEQEDARNGRRRPSFVRLKFCDAINGPGMIRIDRERAAGQLECAAEIV